MKMIRLIVTMVLTVGLGATAIAQSMSKKYKTDNGDGTATASYEFQYRTKPGLMTGLVKGSFAKQLEGTLIGLKHYVETNEKVTPANEKYQKIKDQYQAALVSH